jgi:N-acetylglucosaminyldiphosphoundecaprenol N-acetyl-beta-D-mannosaminyltransferase
LRLLERFAGLQIVGYRNGDFSAEESRLSPRIFAAHSQIFRYSARGDQFSAQGAVPRPPRITARRSLRDGRREAIDVVSGMTRRAPALMQRTDLDWLFRLLQEPRRLFRRYAVTNLSFVCLVVVDMLNAVSVVAP